MSAATIQNPKSKIQNLQWDKMSGLIPAIVQQADSGTVLMLGYMNRQALALTQATGRVHFWSRSRNELWLKGEKSGNYLLVDELKADCDGDALLVRVREATGSTPICHSGATTCFAAPDPNLLPQGAREEDTPHLNPLQPGACEQKPLDTRHPALSTLADVVARLMGGDGCPWDMAQTHTSLKPNLLEETYEALDALDALSTEDDIPREMKLAKLADELGDVLVQVFYQAYLGERDGEFTLNDVAAAIAGKLVRRHPHVFAATTVSGLDEALANWEEIKKQERAEAGGDRSVGAGLRAIPAAMPALHYAQQVQGRVKRSGYCWPERAALLAGLGDQLTAFAQANDGADRLAWVGELLWQAVLLARTLGVNAEEALRLTARHFVNEYQD